LVELSPIAMCRSDRRGLKATPEPMQPNGL
jgi:hypothetical protein